MFQPLKKFRNVTVQCSYFLLRFPEVLVQEKGQQGKEWREENYYTSFILAIKDIIFTCAVYVDGGIYFPTPLPT